MGELRRRGELYFRLIGARVRAQLQYRVSFALDVVGAGLISFTDFLAIVVLFAHLPRLAGWSLGEVAFFYGTANVAFAFCDMIVGHLDLLPRMIRDGSFDLVMVRPAGSLFQVLTSDLQMRRLGRIMQALAVLFFALSRLHVDWTAGRVGMLIGMMVTGTVIYAAVWVVCCTIAFFTVDAQEVSNAFTYGGSFLASYPINIFEGWLRRLLAFLIPMAFVSYFPGLYVLDRADPLGTPPILQFCTPLVATAAALVAGRVWHVAVRHYRSTGS